VPEVAGALFGSWDCSRRDERMLMSRI
jgi:hypothetical protein